ncbi:MAG TPA: hypothetical protein VN628_09470 [Vicinamibacterales bacterium]|nr:hypothetical protein [Vicinamibacterales bacterium]
MLAMVPAAAFAADNLPSGWVKRGSQPAEYEVGVDSTTHHGGRASGYVKSIAKELHGFGTLMQTASPGEYRGRRVRMSAFVKADHVSDWAGVWMRVDGPRAGIDNNLLAIDNMEGRPLKGTFGWKRVEIVLDVAKEATQIAYGILLSKDGQVWMDDLKFEIVPESVPITGREGKTAPSNLDFEK